MAAIIPTYGLADRDNGVCVQVDGLNCSGWNSFGNKFNNTDYQGGSGEFITSTFGGPTLLDYNTYGLAIRFVGGGRTFIIHHGTMQHTVGSDAVFTVSFKSKLGLPPVGSTLNAMYSNMIYDAAINNQISSSLIFDAITNTWSLEVMVVRAGVLLYMNTTNIIDVGLIASLGQRNEHDVVLHTVVSGAILNSGATNDNIFWYVNGVRIDSYRLVAAHIAVAMSYYARIDWNGALGVPFCDVCIRNYAVLPTVLYGNGVNPLYYENAFADGTSLNNTFGNVVDNNMYYAGMTNRIFNFPFILKSRYAGKYPLSYVLPFGGGQTNITYEHITPNRLHNNRLDGKPPKLMIDSSLAIDDLSIDSGAITGLNDNETGVNLETSYPEIINSPIGNNTIIMRPSSSVSTRYFKTWRQMNSGGYDNIVDTDNDWIIYGSSGDTKKNSGMKSEYSYPGIVAKYNGIDGWPICSDRSPSEPVALYADDNVHLTTMVRFEDCIYSMFRFVAINTIAGVNNSENDMALFAAWRDVNAPVAGYWQNLQLVLGKYKLNDRVEDNAVFVNGYRVMATVSPIQQQDCPSLIGTLHAVSPWSQYPDIAIIPIGDPATTTSFRVYYIDSAVAGGVYNFYLKYCDITDNGDTVVGPNSVTFKEYIDNPFSSTLLNSPFQFDVIQPEPNRFLFVITMGNVSDVQGSGIDHDLACVIYDSNDGINLYNPRIFRSNYLGCHATDERYCFAFPSLTYSKIGSGNIEVLLTLTAIDSSGWPLYAFKTGVFQMTYDHINWSNNNARAWSLLIECNKYLSESTYDKDEVRSLCGSAFRDQYGKIHVVVTKIPVNSGTDYFGGLYYMVFDPYNKAYEVVASSTGSREATYGELDLVSFARMYYNNRMLNSNDPVYSYDNALMIRPKFSPLEYDCMLSVNMQTMDAIVLYTNHGRDPIYRLFKPTNMGELFPPSASWHYSCGHPSNANAVLGNQHIWRRSVPSTAPYLLCNGMQFTGAVRKSTHYYLYTGSADTYQYKNVKESMAVKFRFKFTGRSGNPATIYQNECMAVRFYVAYGTVANTNTVQHSDLVGFYFNEDSICAMYTVGCIPVWSMTGLNFTVFRDIMITFWHDPSNNITYWNIYMENSPQIAADGQEKWKPKTWTLLNSDPIAMSDTTSPGWVAETIRFGSSPFASSVNQFNMSELILQYFNIYQPVYKEPGNATTSDINIGGIGAKISNINKSYVGGATKELAFRKKNFDELQLKYCPGVFQTIDNEKESFNNEMIIFLGNNSIYAPTFFRGGTIDEHNDRWLIKRSFSNRASNAFNALPNNYWMNQSEGPTVRIVFDSNYFKRPLSALSADSVWLLNTNLINARLMADPAANWMAPAFSTDILFNVCSGIVTAIGGVIGTDRYIYLEDLTKDWIPNQFVDANNPYYITLNNVALQYYGGKIVKNTKTRIYYVLSLRADGITSYSNFAVGNTYNIIAPSAYKEFTQYSCRYWALDLLPAGLHLYYCDGVARIGGIGIGKQLEIGQYGDSGYSESNGNATNKVEEFDNGINGLIPYGGKISREYSVNFSYINISLKNKLYDIFNSVKFNCIPIWFLPDGDANVNNVMLCDFVDSNLDVKTDIEDYSKLEGVYTIGFKLKERI